MNDILCGYRNRDDRLVSCLYGEINEERAAFDAHLAICPLCRLELSELRAVRSQLEQWAPPEPARAFAPTVSSSSAPPPIAWWRQMPAWAQVAAAVLCVGVAAGVANLDVRYDRTGGLTVRTGWTKPASPAPAPAAVTAGAAPWRADLTALERQLRTEFRNPDVSSLAAQSIVGIGGPRPADAAASSAELLRRVRVLIEESERQQKRELALRLAEAVREFDSQRRADLVKIDRSLGQIQSNTGVEVMRQRELLNYLVRVSSPK